jgi:glycosyltransferase involved in cell wall biosynthesis
VSYVVISPIRDEANYVPGIVAGMVGQSSLPLRWVIVDDGSTDGTSELARAAAAEHDWIRYHGLSDQGERRLGGGVVHAFNAGLEHVHDLDYQFLAKLDADLTLPPPYFEKLLEKFAADPELGTASGKPFLSVDGRLVAERIRDDFSAGQAKLYRRAAFEAIGGLVPALMWDAIDCHRCRQLGWSARSFRDPELRYLHRRLMGSSDRGIARGRMRWGRGHYFMGTHPLYLAEVAIFRAFERPFLLGALWMVWGFLRAWAGGEPRYENREFREFLRRWQLHEALRPWAVRSRS